MANLAVNRRGRFDYEILESYEAGIELRGGEVKSAKTGGADLAGAFVIIRGGEAFLVNAAVAPYQGAGTARGYDPSRPRKLLLHRAELKKLAGAVTTSGLTLVALRLYTKNSKIKLEFGLARRRKKQDRREVIRRREAKREMAR